ncbi:MAG: GAF domain-containing protein [Anaerolineales bacterium]|nr:GAF domain-containing protein [Anaerolineales bacterium]
MSFTVDSEIGSSSSWLQDERKPDLRVRLLRLYILFAVLILAVAILVGLLAKRQIESDVRTADLKIVQTLIDQVNTTGSTTLLRDNILPWLTTAGIEETAVVTLITPAHEITAIVPYGFNMPQTPEWQSWQRRIGRTALFDERGTFISTAPNGDTWLHAYVENPADGGRMILQRPTAVAYIATQQLYQTLFIVLGIFLAGGLFSWLILSHYIIQPLEKLEAFSGRLRWRTESRPEEEIEIRHLALQDDQLGSLGRSLLIMKQETDKRFVELSTLLEMSRVVASSLDANEVIDNILDQVQSLFGVSRCAVVILDKRADVFRISASRGLTEPYANQLRIAPSEPSSPSMRALRNQIPIQVADTESDLAFVKFRQRAQREGFRSVLAIPLKTQHAPPAVLLLYKAKPYSYSYSELELASSFGNHASIALENAALYALTDERLQAQTQRLESIVESLNDGLILASPDNEVLFCNQRALDWLHLNHKEVHGSSTLSLMEPLINATADPERARQNLESSLTIKNAPAFDLTLVGANGRFKDLQIRFFEVSDANGELLGRGQVWQDITRDKAIDRMKSSLLSTVSHELRTPLATIKGYASTLLAEDVQWDAGAQHEFLTAISNETDRLTVLVKNLLDMSRIEAGILSINCELFSINDLLTQVTQGLQPDLKKRLRIHSQMALPPVWMDVPRIGTVMRNLVENAVKYSPETTPIDLITSQDNGSVRFSVRDYGPGIPQDYQDKIFDRFFRVDNRLTRRMGGVGLGLAICKGFVEAHHGDIWVETAAPGAIFNFALPLEKQCE